VATRHVSFSLVRIALVLAGLATGLLGYSAIAAAQNGARQIVIKMANMSYGRIPTDLKVGDTITWVNGDSVPHSVTARDKSFDLRLQPKQSAKLTLSKAGTIQIICIYHPTMRGALKVAAR